MAMFENFPYTDMHNLNLDWIIKIAKDFLDQYTGLQQMIADGEQSLTDLTQEGLNDLQEKADTLQGLLDAWYTEHSTDIANQLADALADLNAWYNTHQSYLNQYLQESITAFGQAADTKAEQTIASIPADYTTLSNDVANVKNTLNFISITENSGYVSVAGVIETAGNWRHSQTIPIKAGQQITAFLRASSGVAVFAEYVDGVTYKVIQVGSGLARYTYVVPRDCQIVVSYDSSQPYMVMVSDANSLNVEMQLQISTNGKLRDANDAADNRLYTINTTASVISNLPTFLTFDADNLYYLLTLSSYNNNAVVFRGQYIIEQKTCAFLAYRRYINNNWEAWAKSVSFASTRFGVAYADIRYDVIDADTVPRGVISFVSTQTPIHMPTGLNYGDNNILITTRVNNGDVTNWDSQYLFVSAARRAFYRFYFNGWRAWTDITPNQNYTIEIGPGKTYTTLKDGFSAAYQLSNAHVIVFPGTYDLTSEFAQALIDHTDRGITLGHGMHVTFMPGAFVTCLLDGSNTWAHSQFSPFSAGDGDFTIDGLYITSQNTRYCVHDEKQGSGIFKHTYINCHMEQTDTTGEPIYTQCIGGGMGANGYIDIIGGFYKSKALHNRSTGGYSSADDLQQPITYHNGTPAACYGKIVIRDVYLADKGYIRIGCYGNATNKTPVQICGCRLGKPTVLMYENDDYRNINFNITSYNNENANSTPVEMTGYINSYD